MRVLILAAFVGTCTFSQAETFRSEGTTFRPLTNAEIVWSATNALPSGLWIYKVMPDALSAAVVSNAMRIGNFETKDSMPPDRPLIKDKHLKYFQNKNEFGKARFLSVGPNVGALDYRSNDDASAPADEVPSAEETERLARNVLFQLGVDRSLLAERVRNGYDNVRTRYDRNRNQKGEPEVTLRGISFERRIDGVALSEAWCFLIHFGNKGVITDYSFGWRNIVPYESHPVATSKQMIEWIKAGKAVIPPNVPADVDTVTKFEVTKVTPRYFNGRKREPLDFMHPYADLEVVANPGSTNAGVFYLSCPLIED